MRLAINGRFLAADVGGVQRFAREVTARLLDLCQVTLHVPAGAQVPPTWRARAAVVEGRLRGQAWEQLELARAHGCDVLLNPANTAPLRYRGPTVLMLHDVLPLVRPDWYGPAFAAWYRLLIPAVARRATRILTTSEHSAHTIATVLGVRGDLVDPVPQGLAPFDRPSPRTAIGRALLGFDSAVPYVLALGGGDARKNVAFARAVMGEYGRRFGGAPRLVVGGQTNPRVFGRAAAAERGLGHVDDADLHALYSGAAAVLSPALAEGFGRVPLEAMCCGTPCIVAERDGVGEMLDGTPARVLPLNVTDWVTTLHQILATGERVPATVGESMRRRWTWAAAAAAVHAACAAAYAGEISPRRRMVSG